MTNESVWAAVAVALINMVGSVLLAWVRAKYRGNGNGNGEPKAPGV